MNLLITPTKVVELAFQAPDYITPGAVHEATILAAEQKFIRPVFGPLYDAMTAAGAGGSGGSGGSGIAGVTGIAGIAGIAGVTGVTGVTGNPESQEGSANPTRISEVAGVAADPSEPIDPSAAEKYAAEKYATEKYAAGKYAAEKYAAEKYATEKYAAGKYAPFVEEFVAPPLALYVKVLMMPSLALQTGAAGVVEPAGKNIARTSDSRLTAAINRLRADAAALIRRAVEHVEANPDSFPEYDPRHNILNHVSTAGGVVLPKTRPCAS